MLSIILISLVGSTQALRIVCDFLFVVVPVAVRKVETQEIREICFKSERISRFMLQLFQDLSFTLSQKFSNS